jgi:hypothetical protein
MFLPDLSQQAEAIREHISDDLIKGIVAGGLGLIGSLLPVVFNWLKDRDVRATRSRELDEAIKVVAFWQAWHVASNAIGTPIDAETRSRATDQLELAGKKVDSLFEFWRPTTYLRQIDRDTFIQKRKSLSFPQRWLLLYKPGRRVAWIPRLVLLAYIPAFLLVGLYRSLEYRERLDDLRRELNEQKPHQSLYRTQPPDALMQKDLERFSKELDGHPVPILKRDDKPKTITSSLFSSEHEPTAQAQSVPNPGSEDDDKPKKSFWRIARTISWMDDLRVWAPAIGWIVLALLVRGVAIRVEVPRLTKVERLSDR